MLVSELLNAPFEEMLRDVNWLSARQAFIVDQRGRVLLSSNEHNSGHLPAGLDADADPAWTTISPNRCVLKSSALHRWVYKAQLDELALAATHGR